MELQNCFTGTKLHKLFHGQCISALNPPTYSKMTTGLTFPGTSFQEVQHFCGQGQPFQLSLNKWGWLR